MKPQANLVEPKIPNLFDFFTISGKTKEQITLCVFLSIVFFIIAIINGMGIKPFLFLDGILIVLLTIIYYLIGRKDWIGFSVKKNNKCYYLYPKSLIKNPQSHINYLDEFLEDFENRDFENIDENIIDAYWYILSQINVEKFTKGFKNNCLAIDIKTAYKSANYKELKTNIEQVNSNFSSIKRGFEFTQWEKENDALMASMAKNQVKIEKTLGEFGSSPNESSEDE